jgi:hypothetical protein
MNSVKNFLNKSISKSSNKIMNINSILYNRFVLYIFVFMAVINLIFFASTNDIRSLITLLIVGFLTSFFSKNMIVILFISLVFTHILKYGTKINEGMENESEPIVDNSGNSIDIEKQKNDKKIKENYSSENKNEVVPTIESLQTDFQDFQTLQEKILKGMKEIDPLLTKAESFIEKFERYKKKGEGIEEDD